MKRYFLLALFALILLSDARPAAAQLSLNLNLNVAAGQQRYIVRSNGGLGPVLNFCSLPGGPAECGPVGTDGSPFLGGASPPSAEAPPHVLSTSARTHSPRPPHTPPA